VQRAEHNKISAAGGTGSSYALTFAAGDIRGEQHSRYSRQTPHSRPLKLFCKILTEFCR